MKNQYFGDINDYKKYGLLRKLANNGQHKIGVCWMLTSNDGRSDGKFTTYLNEPKLWRQYDPMLFDLLQNWVLFQKHRNVTVAENTAIVPKAEYYSEFLTDAQSNRVVYFKEMKEKLSTCDLIFFDPDNGIEIQSKIKGRRDSAKFVYWDEIRDTFQSGHSTLIYQHFPREDHASFIQRIIQEIEVRINPSKAYWFRTSQVVYFLAVQEKHSDYIASRARSVEEQWSGLIQVG